MTVIGRDDLGADSVPAGRIYTVTDIAADPHYQARGMLDKVQMDDGSTLMVPGIVPKLSATPGSHRRNAPTLGQDSEAVLRELGLTPEQIQGLKDKGIVSGAVMDPYADGRSRPPEGAVASFEAARQEAS